MRDANSRLKRAWALFVLTAIVTALGYVLAALNADVVHGATAAWNGFGEVTTWTLLMFTAAGLGLVVAARRPDNRFADVLLAAGLAGMVALGCDQYAGYAL